jgi:putative salt-induced outer membrane protein YdiY
MRFTAGVGYGHQWIETDAISFLTEAGVSYFNTDYRSNTPNEDYMAARLAYKLNWLFSKTSRLIHSVEAFPSLENAEDVYFQADTRLQTNLTDSMIAQLQWVWDYDNTPAPGFERSDNRLLLSVGWTF